jgi:hypothetical protein
MNTTNQDAGGTSETFRNNRLLIAVAFLASVAGFLVGACLAILFVTSLVPLHGYTLARVIWAVCYFVAAWFSWNAGVNMWRLGVGTARHEAILDAAGAHFRLAPEKHAGIQEQFVSWDQIAAIRHRRIGSNQFYSVETKDNRVLAFDAFAFFRSYKLAQRISARAGVPIQELE